MAAAEPEEKFYIASEQLFNKILDMLNNPHLPSVMERANLITEIQNSVRLLNKDNEAKENKEVKK